MTPTIRWALFGLGVVCAVVVVALLVQPQTRLKSSSTLISKSASPSKPKPGGPPWIYGRADARFTIVEYADLECPYCREYFPVLRRWIDANPEVNWQWHHLPLAIHDPASTQTARLAECVGETQGNNAFWNAVAWLYQHTRGGGAGLPVDAPFSDRSPALQACLDSSRPDAIVRAQADAAARDGITATPTLRLIDRKTGKTLTLQGLIDDNALLSAMDMLASSSSALSQVNGH